MSDFHTRNARWGPVGYEHMPKDFLFDLLRHRWGVVAQTRRPNSRFVIKPKTRESVKCTIAHKEDQEGPLYDVAWQLLCDFVGGVTDGQADLGELFSPSTPLCAALGHICDFVPGSRFIHPLDLDDLYFNVHVVRLGTDRVPCYILEPTGDCDVDWKVALHDSVSVLQVLRSHWGPSPIAVIQELVGRGIPFQTLRSHAGCSLLPSDPVRVGHNICSVSSRLYSDDYAAYERNRRAQLSDGRVARAALRRGGIVWRLAMEDLSGTHLTSVAFEPGAVRFDVPTSEGRLVDDDLTTTEADIITGQYRVLTC